MQKGKEDGSRGSGHEPGNVVQNHGQIIHPVAEEVNVIVNDNVDIILPEQVDNPPAGNIEPVVDNLALENVGANVVVVQEDGENAGVLVENHEDVVPVDANVGGMQVDPPPVVPKQCPYS